MLFSSYQFIFLFLPIALAGYYTLLKLGRSKLGLDFLIVMSLIYYAAWYPPYVLLLGTSLLVNYCLGAIIERCHNGHIAMNPIFPMTLGVAANLGFLFYFKYAGFFVDTMNSAAGTDFFFQRVLLPLGISFYTFQKIAYLVDMARGEVKSEGLSRYSLFVLFFPQLIAGPIVHFREVAPQFGRKGLGRFATANITTGLVIFAIGLFKKTVIADTASQFARPVFDLALAGEPVSFWLGWQAALSYTIQLYFDFSGYSDMAIGLARMFGVKLPLNFHSPLKADSIIEYWRRWHMTLQRFIVSYAYQPIAVPLVRLAGRMRLGRWNTFLLSTALPAFAVFVLVGLWHGAGFTFILFGVMHGAYIAVNELWRELWRKRRRKVRPSPWSNAAYFALTFFAVLFANVMFRAESVAAAVRIYAAMLNWASIGEISSGSALVTVATGPMLVITLGFAIIFLFPNTQQIMRRYNPALDWKNWRHAGQVEAALQWRPTLAWAMVLAGTLFLGLIFIMRAQSEFIYFNF